MIQKVENSQKPILTDSLKKQFEGAVPELKIIDGNVGANDKPTYLMVPPLLESSFAHGVPTVDSPNFGLHLSDRKREKLRRSVKRMQNLPSSLGFVKDTFVRAAETRAALADSRVIIARKRAEAAQSGKNQTSLRREVSTLVPWIQSEVLLKDPIATFNKFLSEKKPDDFDYVERTMVDAVNTLLSGINVKPPSLIMDGLSFVGGWWTIPIDWPRALGSLKDHRFDMNATRMFASTAIIDLIPHMTPGISSSHARWGLNTHKLLEQAILVDSMYKHLVLGQENQTIPRSRLYARVAQNMLTNLSQRDQKLNPFSRSPLEVMHDDSIKKARQMRKSLGIKNRKGQFLNTQELQAYQEYAKNPEQFYILLTYTMATKLESALDVVNNASPKPAKYK